RSFRVLVRDSVLELAVWQPRSIGGWPPGLRREYRQRRDSGQGQCRALEGFTFACPVVSPSIFFGKSRALGPKSDPADSSKTSLMFRVRSYRIAPAVAEMPIWIKPLSLPFGSRCCDADLSRRSAVPFPGAQSAAAGHPFPGGFPSRGAALCRS